MHLHLAYLGFSDRWVRGGEGRWLGRRARWWRLGGVEGVMVLETQVDIGRPTRGVRMEQMIRAILVLGWDILVTGLAGLKI